MEEVKKQHTLIRILKSPFFLLTLAFGIWLIFFDSNSYLSQKKQQEKYNALKEQGEFYQSEVERIEVNIDAIENDPEELEKFARENYMYKKKGEEIYVIEEKKKEED